MKNCCMEGEYGNREKNRERRNCGRKRNKK